MKLAHTVATPDTADAGMLALRGSLEENFRTLAALGYSGVELMVRDPASLDAAAILALSGDCGLDVAAVSTGQLRKEDGLTLSDADPARRARALARTLEAVDFAARFGAHLNIGTLRGTDPAAAAESFRRLLPYAAARGVRVAVEPQCRWVSNWLNSVDETLRWREDFDPPPGLLFDAYHAALEEESATAALVRALPALTMIQVSDSNRRAPGWGHAPLADLLRLAAALGYGGYVVLECRQEPDSAAQFARWARAHAL